MIRLSVAALAAATVLASARSNKMTRAPDPIAEGIDAAGGVQE